MLFIVLLAISGCSSPSDLMPEPGKSATLDPPPTFTPNPSATPPPPTQTTTPTQTPTATPSPTPSPTVPPVTRILFTGAIVPGRCVQAAIDEQGNADYLYDDIRHIIQSSDYAVGVLNAALSDYPPRTGCVSTFVLVGGSENADAMARAGFDMVNIATNHIKNCGLTDCGDRAFLDTLANLARVGLTTVGAGMNHEEALKPVVVNINGIKFGFVALGEVEPNAFADDNTPGIAVLTDENLTRAIQNAHQLADVVIAMPHWGPDYAHMPNYRQIHFAKVAVKAGADLVVGNHAHVIQGWQTIDDVPVFYGLGSLVFDQTWSLETQQGIIIIVTFVGKSFQGFEVIPIHIARNGAALLAEEAEKEDILRQFEQYSQALEGYIP